MTRIMDVNTITIRFRFHDPEQSSVHRIRNFGEDLWRAFRDNRRDHISLTDIDAAVDEIALRTRPSRVHRTLKQVQTILAEHMMTDECSVTIERPNLSPHDH